MNELSRKSLDRSLLYDAAVGALGIAALVAVLAGGVDLPTSDARFWVLAAAVVLGELFPVSVLLRSDQYAITTSTCFSFALLLSFGLPAALVAQVLGSLAADVRARRRPWWRSLDIGAFNVGQYALALAAAAGVLALAGYARAQSGVPFSPADFPWIVLAGLALFTVNTLLVAISASIERGPAVVGDHMRQPEYYAYVGGLLGLAPIVVLSIYFSPLFLLLLVVSVAASHYSMRQALRHQHRALHDPLTGLPNRVLFADRVRAASKSVARSGGTAAVMLVDLDGFKRVNDLHGHRCGDEVLREVAARAGLRLRSSDTFARLGGDEFGVLLPDVRDTDAVVDVAFAVKRTLGLVGAESGGPLGIEASVGIAYVPEHGHELEDLLDKADAAMYRAKQRRSGVAVYEPAWEVEAPARRKATTF